jgi:hypothetical protein
MFINAKESSNISLFSSSSFFIGGLIGLVAAIFLFRRLANSKILAAYDDSLEIEQFLWKEKVWYDYKESLHSLFINIRFLVKKYYNGYSEPILSNSKKEEEFIDNLVPKRELHKQYKYLVHEVKEKKNIHQVIDDYDKEKY